MKKIVGVYSFQLAESRLTSLRKLELGGVPRPVTPAYGTISQAFRNAIVNIVTGADTQTERSNAADRIDRETAAHYGYPYP